MTYTIPAHRRGDTWDGVNSIIINVNGVPINLTDAVIKIDFRQSLDSPVVLTLSTNDGTIEVIKLLEGSIRIPPKKIEIPFGKYMYDLQVTYPNGVIKTYMEGTWEIKPDITT